MTVSTPPAWHFLQERYVPTGVPELSIDSRKLPDSATLRERNDSNPDPTYQDCWPSERYRSDGPDGAGVQSVRETPTKLRVGARNEHPPETTSPAFSCVVESCPECGTVTDIEYPPLSPDGTLIFTSEVEYPAKVADSFDVPFPVQEFMFEELCEEKLAELPHLIFTHSERIIEMARDRFRKGYAKYGSAAYQWDAGTRMTNVLEELADAVVYLTTGSAETSVVTDKC